MMACSFCKFTADNSCEESTPGFGFEISSDNQKYKAQSYTAQEIEARPGVLGLVVAVLRQI
jgi:hypothetical protein